MNTLRPVEAGLVATGSVARILLCTDLDPAAKIWRLRDYGQDFLEQLYLVEAGLVAAHVGDPPAVLVAQMEDLNTAHLFV